MFSGSTLQKWTLASILKSVVFKIIMDICFAAVYLWRVQSFSSNSNLYFGPFMFYCMAMAAVRKHFVLKLYFKLSDCYKCLHEMWLCFGYFLQIMILRAFPFKNPLNFYSNFFKHCAHPLKNWEYFIGTMHIRYYYQKTEKNAYFLLNVLCWILNSRNILNDRPGAILIQRQKLFYMYHFGFTSCFR